MARYCSIFHRRCWGSVQSGSWLQGPSLSGLLCKALHQMEGLLPQPVAKGATKYINQKIYIPVVYIWFTIPHLDYLILPLPYIMSFVYIKTQEKSCLCIGTFVALMNWVLRCCAEDKEQMSWACFATTYGISRGISTVHLWKTTVFFF